MGQFGEALRRERESRGIALDAIADDTKISNRHLVALEQEEFSQLPGGVLNKGIVRGYARVVGLDAEDWVGRFVSAYQESGAVIADDASWMAFAENVSRARHDEDAPNPERRLRWAGIVVLLAVLGVLGWYVWHYVEQKEALNGAGSGHRVTQSAERRLPPQRYPFTLC
jgi:cytoskeleton protein RodZ